MRNDVLLDIATFLARRWSANSKVVIVLKKNTMPISKPEKNQIILPALDYYPGTSFQKYRQWRVALWYESMRMRYSTKVLSYEHAFGFLLNTVETKRVEILGLKDWNGMTKEVIFNEGISWLSRPLLNSLYGKYKIVEAFSQYFLTGYLKGELYGSLFDKVKNGSELANTVVLQGVNNNYDTRWIEQHIPQILKILEIDSLISIPIIAPRTRIGLSMNQNDLVRELEKIVTARQRDKNIYETTKDIVEGKDILGEYKSLMNESKKTDNKGYESLENFGLSIPERMDIDETQIYDIPLIKRVKDSFRDLKTGLIEIHEQTGEEFDVESYVETLSRPFLTDFKLSIKTTVAVLLDHSSSMANIELEYKKITVALCEALHFLGIKFAVYVFNTETRQIKCWVIKAGNMKWSRVSARRLAQIQASGGTPLAEIYGLLHPIIKSFKPDVMVTLTDGEPSDFEAVRNMIKLYRKVGIHMMALGIGRTLHDSVNISNNLKYLNYEKILSVSRLNDIPKKLIDLLQT
jgi:hypothetical protein